MSLTVEEVAERVERAMAEIADARLVDALRPFLVPPRACSLHWDYGVSGDERYPAFIVGVLGDSGAAIAYSEHGFAPACPWGLIDLREMAYGMDAQWDLTLEDAFRSSGAWRGPNPEGYERG